MADWTLRLRFAVEDQVFTNPTHHRDGEWLWTARPKRLVWWSFVPMPLKRAFVQRMNVRHCARTGHDDLMWHLNESGDWLAKDVPTCINCLVPLTACSGYHPRDKRTAPLVTPPQSEEATR